MSKFKAGDRVRCAMGYEYCGPLTGWTGTVYEVASDYPVFRARWDQNPCASDYHNVCCDTRAELIEQPKAMPTTNNDHIEQQLLAILNAHVPTDAYLAAENKARKTEREEGTLRDLRAARDYVLDTVHELADLIRKLQLEVNSINGTNP